MSNNWNLQGRRALVTGGSKGIGEATAKLFTELGAQVVIVARNEIEMKQQLDSWRAEGILIKGICADLSRPDESQRILKEYSRLTSAGQLDVLVNNVGIPLKKIDS